jgi:hypothetical protein
MQEPLIFKTQHLVIAKYNEDVSWTHKVYNYKSFIYNKHNVHFHLSYIPLINIGKEAHTYLTHIIDNYNDLADYTIFCQGHPFDHCPDFLKKLNQPIYENFNWYTDKISDKGHAVRLWGVSLYTSEMLQRSGFYNIPKRLIFGAGAQFGITRELILQKPLCFYQHLLGLFSRKNLYESWLVGATLSNGQGSFYKRRGVYNFYFTACAFERIWWYIFNHPHFDVKLIATD